MPKANTFRSGALPFSTSTVLLAVLIASAAVTLYFIARFCDRCFGTDLAETRENQT